MDKDFLVARIKTLEEELGKFLDDANRELAYRQGAIAELRFLLEQWNKPVIEMGDIAEVSANCREIVEGKRQEV